MPERQPAAIGLVLCECGGNISEKLDLEAIAAWAQQQPGVGFVLRHELLCSLEGTAFLEKIIREKKPSALVLAACSPRAHEITFRTVALKTSLNFGKVQMANIREHCAWVTEDRHAATAKAISLIRAAFQRIKHHEALALRSMECLTDIVVIGGGLAGMEAALLASAAGRKVTIIEKNIALGGRIIHVEELAPNLECAPCLISPRLFKIKDDPNIRIMANADVTEITGFYGNFSIKAKQRARFITEACIGCEACFEACPVTVKSEFHLGLGDRKAVHMLYTGAIPAAAAIDQSACLRLQGQACDACAQACPFGAVNFADQDREVEVKAGAVILATGFEPYNPSGISRLGYGRLPEVYTLPEFERLTNANGPYQGTLRMKNGAKPEAVAVIHCAGSLAKEHLDYCSGICCMLAVKTGEVLRKQNPGSRVFHVHDRLVLRGADAERFYRQQIHEGSVFLRTPDLESIQVSETAGKLMVTASGIAPLSVDMVVLVTGLAPGAETARLAELAGLELTEAGFFQSDHYYLRSVGATLDGIYAVGSCLAPCDARETVAQAQAAAGEAVSRLVPGRQINLEILTAAVDEKLCSGCKLCIPVCPYHAITYNQEKNISQINQAICRGCGTCAAACPSQAITATQFSNAQIIAEVKGVLHE